MEHFFQNIKGWFAFSKLYDEMVKTARDGAIFVEIGAWKGRSTAYMLVAIANSKKDIKFHVVDHFKGSAEHIRREEPEVMDGSLYNVFLKNISPADKYLTAVHRMDSVEAAKLFEDESVDFVLIDASHDRDSVLADLVAWHPKLKIGGTMGGDDWTKKGVRQAVEEFYGEKPQLHGGISKRGERKCWRVTRK